MNGFDFQNHIKLITFLKQVLQWWNPQKENLQLTKRDLAACLQWKGFSCLRKVHPVLITPGIQPRYWLRCHPSSISSISSNSSISSTSSISSHFLPQKSESGPDQSWNPAKYWLRWPFSCTSSPCVLYVCFKLATKNKFCSVFFTESMAINHLHLQWSWVSMHDKFDYSFSTFFSSILIDWAMDLKFMRWLGLIRI